MEKVTRAWDKHDVIELTEFMEIVLTEEQVALIVETANNFDALDEGSQIVMLSLTSHGKSWFKP